MRIGSKDFATWHRTYVMGILNVTPDSFSDGGKWSGIDRALAQVERMIEEGADIIDIGGESTRPGYTQISVEEELGRILPVIEEVKKRFSIPLSVDTYKSRVAARAIDAGIDLVNDIWGLRYDEGMAGVLAESGCACCLMHNRREAAYRELVPDICSDLKETLRIAKEAGIRDDRIILDPGIGFGKTYEQNLEVLRRLEEFGTLGYPLLLGASRKSVIGNTLQLPVGERLEGTLAVTVLAVAKRCAFVRVHDVRANVRAIRMAEAVLYHSEGKGSEG